MMFNLNGSLKISCNFLVIFHICNFFLCGLLNFEPVTGFVMFLFSFNYYLIQSLYIGSNGSQDSAREDQENATVTFACKTLKRSGFSDTFSPNGMLLAIFICISRYRLFNFLLSNARLLFQN